MEIRPVLDGDAVALTPVAVRCLAATYTDLLPSTVVARLPLQARLAEWTAGICGDVGAVACVAERGSAVVGFAAGRAVAGVQGLGEIEAIYLLPGAQACGYGARLFAAVCVGLCDRGLASLSLWTLAGNVRARRFYERLGGLTGGVKRFSVEGATLTEVEYRWPDLRIALDRCGGPPGAGDLRVPAIASAA